MIVQALIYPNFTTLDLIGALQPLAQMPSVQVEIVAKEAGEIATDCGAPIVASRSFETATPSPDVLLVPGGARPTLETMEDIETINFLARQGQNAKWVVAVCTGSLLLGQAGLLKGYHAATHWAAIDTLNAFGAIPTHKRVVIDRNRCTGGGVTAGVDIGLTLAGAIGGEEAGKLIELVLEYNPKPPFGTGHPSLADKTTLDMANIGVNTEFPSDRIRAIAKESPFLAR